MKYPALCALALLIPCLPANADETNLAGQFLTPQIAAAALGTGVKPGTPEPDTTMGSTTVSHASYSAGDGRQITLLVRRGDSPDQTEGIFESSKDTFHGEAVAGLGDAAYRTKMPAQLDVLAGKDWLIISAGTFKSPDPVAQEKAATAILKNLVK